ncbi:MAG: LOG family protein [Candidatus Obscuribacterales bacterium]|jgi:uncharacterized protein (TIGR00730 family)|nr:LOG family protein [Candidatus Obscuribacterales bacterium]
MSKTFKHRKNPKPALTVADTGFFKTVMAFVSKQFGKGLTKKDQTSLVKIIIQTVKGFKLLGKLKNNYCVTFFASARLKENSEAYRLGRYIASELAIRSNKKIAIITGGGPGGMEAANRGAHEAGTLSCGISIKLPHETKSNDYVHPALDYICENFFIRKYLMVKQTKAVVVLAGGIGTIEEAFEVATLKQNSHCQTMPIYFIDQDGMYSKLMRWYEECVVEKGMLRVEEMERLWKVVPVDQVDQMIDEIVAQSLAA